MPKCINISGKTINLEKLASKSEAQFRQQLRQNGIEVTDEQFAALWEQLQKSLTNAAKRSEEAAAAAAKEEEA